MKYQFIDGEKYSLRFCVAAYPETAKLGYYPFIQGSIGKRHERDAPVLFV